MIFISEWTHFYIFNYFYSLPMVRNTSLRVYLCLIYSVSIKLYYTRDIFPRNFCLFLPISQSASCRPLSSYIFPREDEVFVNFRFQSQGIPVFPPFPRHNKLFLSLRFVLHVSWSAQRISVTRNSPRK